MYLNVTYIFSKITFISISSVWMDCFSCNVLPSDIVYIIPKTQIINYHLQNLSKIDITRIRPYPTHNCNIAIYKFPSKAGNYSERRIGVKYGGESVISVSVVVTS
jgi:hypothetical protein